MKKISMYVTELSSSISVTNGVTREVTAPSINEAVASMHGADLLPLKQLCQAIIEAIPQRAEKLIGEQG